MIPSIENRRSIRKYSPQPVEDEKIEQILEAARQAPSGHNLQPWSFIVVRSRETRVALMEADHQQEWMMSAPVFIVAVADLQARVKDTSGIAVDEYSDSWELKRCIRDTAIAVRYLLLQADALGLGTCWTGFYEQADMRPLLNLPDDKFVVGVVTLGYPAEDPARRSRKPLSEIVRYEKWQD